MNIDKAVLLAREFLQKCEFDHVAIKKSEDQPEEITNYDILIEDLTTSSVQMMEMLKIIEEFEIKVEFVIITDGVLVFDTEA